MKDDYGCFNVFLSSLEKKGYSMTDAKGMVCKELLKIPQDDEVAVCRRFGMGYVDFHSDDWTRDFSVDEKRVDRILGVLRERLVIVANELPDKLGQVA